MILEQKTQFRAGWCMCWEER